MSRTHCRGSIATAAILVALLSSRPAEAQVGSRPGATFEPGGLYYNLVTGVQYDLINQAKAEQRLQHVQSKLRSDAERQNSVAVDRGVRRIANLNHRIMVDEWLIRYNSCQQLGPYPNSVCLDPITRAAIADVARPQGAPPTPIPCGRWYAR